MEIRHDLGTASTLAQASTDVSANSSALGSAKASAPVLKSAAASAKVFFLESTFKDQINPNRQTAGPPEGGSPELDLASIGLSLLRLSPTLRPSHF